MNLFFKCPFQWKLRYIDRLQGSYVKNDKQLLGKNLHDIIASYFRSIPDKPTPKQIEGIAKSTFTAFFMPELKNYQKDAENMLNNFIKFELNRLPTYRKPIMIERHLEDDTFQGNLDYFDGVNIIDWKTGNMLTLEDDERRQGKIYERLVNNNGFRDPAFGAYKNYKIYFGVLSTGRLLELPQTTESWLMNQANIMYDRVSRGLFEKKYTPLCNWDEFQTRCNFEGVDFWNESFRHL